MRVETIEALTHDIHRLVLSGDELKFKPGQYVDIKIPGTEEVRSFSMANLPGGELEFMIKVYPDGKFSSLLAERRAQGGRRARGHRPLRRVHAAGEVRPAAAVHRRRRRHGADPGAAARDGRQRAPSGRPSTTTALAARRTCFTSRSWPSSSGGCRTSASCPALSDCGEDEDWERRARADHRRGRPLRGGAGRGGRIPVRTAADGRRRHRTAGRRTACPRHRVFYDKFTTTAP